MIAADIARYTKATDAALRKFLPPASATPSTVHKAMRHSMFAGGKRLRPALTLAAAEACGGKIEDALPQACAVECIHTFSLIHDDLPCMDDDDLRRGVPTCHVVYGEAMALLAGDAMQALAFEILADAPAAGTYTPGNYVKELAATAGSKLLVGGQVLDLEGEEKTDVTVRRPQSDPRTQNRRPPHIKPAPRRHGRRSKTRRGHRARCLRKIPRPSLPSYRRHPRRNPDFREARQNCR